MELVQLAEAHCILTTQKKREKGVVTKKDTNEVFRSGNLCRSIVAVQATVTDTATFPVQYTEKSL